MTTSNERSYTNRRRAESFGALAAQYDRSRPSYPDGLIADLVPTAPLDVLDVGCGTGLAAVKLAARGAQVLGVEIDERMAEVARANGIAVEVGGFEEWDEAGRMFDLVTSGQAWHWIDPEAGARKAARVLRPGGRIALFWNLGTYQPDVSTRIDAIYDEVAPEMSKSVLCGGGRDVGTYLPSLEGAGFTDLQQRTYDWQQTYPGERWLDLLATHSDHATLPPERFAELHDRVAGLLDDLGGAIVVDYETRVVLGRRLPGS